MIPLPNPGEGGPVADSPNAGDATPVIPLPTPEQGQPIPDRPGDDESTAILPPGVILPNRPRGARVRFFNAAVGYPPFRVFLNHRRMAGFLSTSSITGYSTVSARYHTISISGTNGYIYLQKTILLEAGSTSTIAIINRPGGLDLLQINDLCCPPSDGSANFRVGNLALRSGPIDVLLGDGRTIYADVRFKEITSFKRIQPGAYQFLFAETNFLPIPENMDIESLDASFIGLSPDPQLVASLYVEIQRNANYTVYLLNNAPNSTAIQTVLVEDQ